MAFPKQSPTVSLIYQVSRKLNYFCDAFENVFTYISTLTMFLTSFLAYGASVGIIPTVIDVKLPPSTIGSAPPLAKPQTPAGKCFRNLVD